MYHESEVTIVENLLKQDQISTFFNYLREMAKYLTISDITQSDEEQVNNDFLSKIYEKVDFIKPDSIIKEYVQGIEPLHLKNMSQSFIYPFYFNLSQKKAIKNAFSNHISIIEGPHETGKTQTILNIISNAIIQNKTVVVLSNNNSATDNVFEKLEKQNLGSICAKLGKRKNIEKFIASQSQLKSYPTTWCLNEIERKQIKEKLVSINKDIEIYLSEKNAIAIKKQEVEELKLEKKYFEESINIPETKKINLPIFDSTKLHSYLLYLNKQKK